MTDRHSTTSVVHKALEGQYGMIVQLAIILAGLAFGFVWLVDYTAEKRDETRAKIEMMERRIERLEREYYAR